MSMKAIIAYSPIGIAEDGAFGIAMARRMQFFPRATDEILKASSLRSYLVGNAMLAKESVEVKRRQVIGLQRAHHVPQQLA